MITTTKSTATRSIFPQTNQTQTKRRRRELVPVRRLPRNRHKEIRQAIKAAKAQRAKFPALKHHFDGFIRSLQVAIITDIICAIEEASAWCTEDFMDYCRASRRVVDGILDELVKQGLVNKSTFHPGGKGRPRNKFQATARALEMQRRFKNEK